MKLFEGGNVFKDSKGVPLTQRINQTDVKPTLMWLDQLTPGLDLTNNMLGSTGLKPTSGDLDVAVDSNKVKKEDLYNHLVNWAKSNGLQPNEWVRKSGTSVHFKTPITGRPDRGFVQTDFMFLQNVPFSKFILRSDPDSEYKGALRNIMINSMAKAMGYKLNQLAGLQDRATNEIITDNPDEVAKILLNKNATSADLASVEKILAALQKDPQREQKIADFRAHMGREGIPFNESLEENEVSFIARLRDRIVNQGMQPIYEGVRIEHPEDMVFDQGSKGISNAVRGIVSAAKNPQTTTVKWDGKPAIIFGRNPSGQFVLTDKSGFLSKSYNGLATSPGEIERIMRARGGNRDELIGIYQKLFPLLEAAVPRDFRGYIQGDLLYTQTPQVINGHYVFTPNTVTYSVDASSPLGQKIKGSQAAVAIHTALAAPGAPAQAITTASLNDVPGLLIVDPSLKEPRKIKIDQNKVKDLNAVVQQFGRDIDQLFNPQELRARKISNMPALMKTYINTRVRQGNYSNIIGGFTEWVKHKEPTKAPRILEWMGQNRRGVVALFQAFLELSALKNEIVRQLDAQAHDVKASINNEPGHEGYVGQGMKFVDRMRFSQANFAKNNPDLK